MNKHTAVRAKAISVSEVYDLPPIVPVYPVVGRIWQIGKTALYELAARDELPVPVIKVGRLLRARRVDILQALGLVEDDPKARHENGDAGAATPASVERNTSISNENGTRS